jgi:hypothetical protein
MAGIVRNSPTEPAQFAGIHAGKIFFVLSIQKDIPFSSLCTIVATLLYFASGGWPAG